MILGKLQHVVVPVEYQRTDQGVLPNDVRYVDPIQGDQVKSDKLQMHNEKIQPEEKNKL
jgi:hypothetical protein